MSDRLHGADSQSRTPSQADELAQMAILSIKSAGGYFMRIVEIETQAKMLTDARNRVEAFEAKYPPNTVYRSIPLAEFLQTTATIMALPFWSLTTAENC